MKEYALLSCFDKKNIEAFAETLIKLGYHLLATGGTYSTLKKKYPVTEVSELTQKPEIFGGRVKTLQYEIQGGILMRATEQDAAEWPYDFRISVVACNFYPFSEKAQTVQNTNELLEWIDIGGPTMVRAAAKNYSSVYVFTDPAQYAWLEKNPFGTDVKLREELSLQAFDRLLELDQQIVFELRHRLRSSDLKYGENPHQAAAFSPASNFEFFGETTPGYNNLRDAEAALRFVLPFQGSAISVVKHGTLCGAAVSLNENIDDVFAEAWEGDTVSRFGGILAFNRTPTRAILQTLQKKFVEVLVLPANADSRSWTEELLKSHKARVFLYDESVRKKQLESVSGIFGTLLQERDSSKYFMQQKTLQDLEKLFAIWTSACSKSNAISLVGTNAEKNLTYLAGAGQGQPNRIEALEKLALPRAKNFCERRGYKLDSLVCASDAFFPFDDILHVLHAAGIKRILQPGGSKNDPTVIETAKKYHMQMDLTGERHFWH